MIEALLVQQASAGVPVFWIVVSAAGTLAATILGAWATFRKAGPERVNLMVDAASDVVVIQRGVIAELRETLERLESEVRACRKELTEVKAKNVQLEGDNARLRNRVKHLEDGNGGS